MLVFEILERLEAILGEFQYKIKQGKMQTTLIVGQALDDSTIDQVLATLANHIGDIEHSAQCTTVTIF